jgi:hypothetical protein
MFAAFKNEMETSEIFFIIFNGFLKVWNFEYEKTVKINLIEIFI